MAIYSYAPFGYEGDLSIVEIDIRNGLPSFDICGIKDSLCEECRTTLKKAFLSSDYKFPDNKRIMLSLHPADESSYNKSLSQLAFAIALINEYPKDENILVVGSLDEYGNVESTSRNIFAALQTAKKHGITKAIIPNCSVAIPEGMKVWKVDHLKDAVDIFDQVLGRKPLKIDALEHVSTSSNKVFQNTSSLDNYTSAIKYPLAVAIAGRHHALFWGTDIEFTNSICRCIPELQPTLTNEELESVNRIYSIAGYDNNSNKRPFRIPHQSASVEGICGGGVNCNPGEISMAHNGVLLLEDAAEFKSSVLQLLRVPIESGRITLSRGGRTSSYPARFQLIMTARPCSCGNYDSPNKLCLCSSHAIEQYWKKFSSPLLDRFPIRIHTNDSLKYPEFSVKILKTMIETAVDKQRTRGTYNQYADICLPNKLDKMLTQHCVRNNLSVRSRRNIIRVARTIADMHGYDEILSVHLTEAFSMFGDLII